MGEIPNWECMFVHRKPGLFLSVFVDDIKMDCKNKNLAPMWKKMMKNVDIDEPASFLDHVYLGCIERSCKPNGTIIEQYTKMFESRISAEAIKNYQDDRNRTHKLQHGPTTWNDMLNNALNDTVKWQRKKWSNFTKFHILVWMIINSNRKKSNLLENYQKFAHKLS